MRQLSQYKETALRGMIYIPQHDRIPNDVSIVWDNMNDRLASINAYWQRRMLARLAHIQSLEAKLAERRSEFSQTMVIALIVSKCRRHVLASEIEGSLYLPGTVALQGDTSGETFAAVVCGVGVVTDAPREIGVQKDVTESGLKLARVYMGAFQDKNDKGNMMQQVKWFNIGDTRIADNERTVINYLLGV